MLNKKIFKAYDIRGIYPTDLNKDTMAIIARAIADVLSSGKVVIARDGRHGGKELYQTLEEKLVYYGSAINKEFEIISVGLSTSPMFSFLVNYYKASGGAMITASHSPKEYNGVKIAKENAVNCSGTELLQIIEEKGYDK